MARPTTSSEETAQVPLADLDAVLDILDESQSHDNGTPIPDHEAHLNHGSYRISLIGGPDVHPPGEGGPVDKSARPSGDLAMISSWKPA